MERLKINTFTKLYPLLIILIVASLPLVMTGKSGKYLVLLMCIMGMYVIAVSGLDILFGYSGQISLGHAAFYAIGAYGSTLLSMKLKIPVFLSMILGSLIATIMAIILGLMVSKLVRHFLSLVTIGFGEMIYQVVGQGADNFTGGFTGINFIPDLQFGSFVINTNIRYFYFILIAVALFLIIKSRIINSRTGRALIAIKENTLAANCMGINVKKYKTIAFAISAFYTAYAGAIYAHFVGFICPETFTSTQSVSFLTMVLFGGMGSQAGPIIGAIMLTLINELLMALRSYQMLIYGVFLLIVLLFMPTGIYGSVKNMMIKFKKRNILKKSDGEENAGT